MAALGYFLRRGASISYGLLCLGMYTVFAVVDGSVFKRSTEKERNELAIARAKFWDLARSGEFRHNFFVLKSGVKLHYISNDSPSRRSRSSLVIFLHGFPDSCLLFRTFLQSKVLLEHSTLVALDLPGYGGSDGLSTYDANHMLEAISEYILGMRETYINERDGGRDEQRGRVVVVGHDWGAIIACRLAAEAPQLADRFIVSNGAYPPLAVDNVKARMSSSGHMLATWRHHPTRSLSLLRGALTTVGPVFNQIKMSGYVFVFNLPWPLPSLLGSLGHYWFLRLAHAIAARRRHPLESGEAAEALASSLGPGIAESESRLPNGDRDSYPASIRMRAKDGGWSEKIRLYREDLAIQPWDKTLETVAALYNIGDEDDGRRHSSSGGGYLELGPQGSFKAPMTVVFGLEDSALDARIALEGWTEYCVKSSQVITLEGVNHWVPCEEKGVEVLEEVIRWAVEGEEEAMGRVVARLGKGVHMTAEK